MKIKAASVGQAQHCVSSSRSGLEAPPVLLVLASNSSLHPLLPQYLANILLVAPVSQPRKLGSIFELQHSFFFRFFLINATLRCVCDCQKISRRLQNASIWIAIRFCLQKEMALLSWVELNPNKNGWLDKSMPTSASHGLWWGRWWSASFVKLKCCCPMPRLAQTGKQKLRNWRWSPNRKAIRF